MREGQTREGYWMCTCGKENRGRAKSCAGCGKPPDENTKFYLVSREDGNLGKVIKNYENKGPDWICDHCGTMNPATLDHCKGCGNEKDHEDTGYFDHHPERKGFIGRPEDFTGKAEHLAATRLSPDIKDSSCTDSANTRHYPDYSGSSSYDTNRGIHFSLPSIDINWSALIKVLGVIVCIALVVMGAIAIFAPKERDLTIETKSWVSRVCVEEYRTVHESDWDIPTGGRMTNSYSAIHHYDTVFDHYETVQIPKTRDVLSGGHYESVGWRDNGDGTFTELQDWVPEYRTETYYESKQEPVYVQEPVYRTKYEYDIERWVFDHYETARGGDTEPYYAEVVTDKTHRISGRSTELKATASYYSGEEKKTESFTLEESDWRSIQIGQEVHAKVYFGNRVELIFDDQ